MFRYSYDAAGNRIRKEEETGKDQRIRTEYAYNEKNQLIHMEEFLPDGSQRRNTFTYSKQGSILREETESGISRYFYNSKNQQIRVERADGQIQENLYDAFGVGLEVSEELPNRIRYTGQQYDGVTEQYYLRARYYNPILGRFLQEDVYQGNCKI